MMSARLLLSLLLLSLLTSPRAFGQAGMRESLERLDRNDNGYLDPDEITPLSRPFLERIAESRRLRLDRPTELSELQIAARIYYAIKNLSLIHI